MYYSLAVWELYRARRFCIKKKKKHCYRRFFNHNVRLSPILRWCFCVSSKVWFWLLWFWLPRPLTPALRASLTVVGLPLPLFFYLGSYIYIVLAAQQSPFFIAARIKVKGETTYKYDISHSNTPWLKKWHVWRLFRDTEVYSYWRKQQVLDVKPRLVDEPLK